MWEWHPSTSAQNPLTFTTIRGAAHLHTNTHILGQFGHRFRMDHRPIINLVADRGRVLHHPDADPHRRTTGSQRRTSCKAAFSIAATGGESLPP